MPPSGPWQQALGPGVLPAIRQSADQLAYQQEAFTRQLRSDVAGLIPDGAVPATFDLRGFCARMVQTMLWTALTDQPLPVVVETLHQVGARNWLDGLPDQEYGSFAHALVQAVHYLTHIEWSTSTGSAWISFFMWMKPHLLAGAAQAAAQDAATREAAAREAAAQRAAAEREAARVAALSRRHSHVVGDVNIERVASLLDEDDEEDGGYGQIMVSMTRNPLSPRNQEPPSRGRPGDRDDGAS
jgi:hypothetical protein